MTKTKEIEKINNFLVNNEKIEFNSKNYEKIEFIYGIAIKEIKHKLEILKEEYKMFYNYDLIDHINERIKSKESISKKMTKKGIDFTYSKMIENINDIAGVRVICPLKKDIYTIRKLITNLPGIKILKENKILYPKGLWYEDRATTGQYINFCKKIYYVSEGFYTYRQRDNSIMKQNSYNPKMLDICQAMKMFDRQVDDHEYKSEKEYLFISNLLFQNSLRLLPLKKNKEMKECYDILEKKYPNWKQNVYYKKQSKGYKILCLLISKRLYFISRILIKYKMKGA